MDTRNHHESRNRLATGLRAATVAVVVGTLVAVWHPMHGSDAAPAVVANPSPDMSVYFPDRFPAPQGEAEPLPPQF
ncbi:MAG TPA: hypothetical protein VLG08_01800 [Casimicrobiaceae bacterium]|jgi:hypothetical protein|nr:hypothetical protein [Casimicrobiaceae bacterium]